MKITAITPQVKNKERYSIFVDGKYSFSLSEVGLLNSGINIGLELSPEELKQLKDDSSADKLYNAALQLIVRRPRSEKELKDYLARKTTDEMFREKILNMLSNTGQVNDEAFARRWVENRRLLKPTSKRKLRLELLQKGISDSIISSTLSDDETDELDVLRDLVIKKRRQTRYQDDTKLMQFLIRQGFNYDDIKTVLAEEA